MPAATTFLILKKDGKEKSWWPCPTVFNGEIPTNHMERVLFTKIPSGGEYPRGKTSTDGLITQFLHYFQAIKAFQHLEHQETSKH